MALDDAKQVDLAKRAEELAAEAERLRQDGEGGAASDRDRESDAKLSSSIEKLRRIARS
jgi:hypothetical protein